MGMSSGNHDGLVRILCSDLVKTRSEPVLQWLIGIPSLPSLTIVSAFRCLHTVDNSRSPDYLKESDDLRTLLPKGFEVIGALKTSGGSGSEGTAREAINAAYSLRRRLNYGAMEREIIGVVSESENGGVQFYVSKSENASNIARVDTVEYVDDSVKFVRENLCLLRCFVPIKLPIFLPLNNPSVAEKTYSRVIDSLAAKFKDTQTVYLLEAGNIGSSEACTSTIIRGLDLEFSKEISSFLPRESGLSCRQLCSETEFLLTPAENADLINVTVMQNTSSKQSKSTAPTAEYIPATEEAKTCSLSVNLDILCFAGKELPVKHAISALVVPGLIDQLNSIKKSSSSTILSKQIQLHPYHFKPPGLLHPVTALYELDYGETEQKQVDVRRSLHMRLGLPLDRPLFRIANAMNFSADDSKNTRTKASSVLSDVHVGIPSSGVSGGVTSLVQGSYKYYHYLQEGFDDTNWGCAYRSLQTIISWFKLQHYTAIDVPSHREIQQALVEIGDKSPSFVGSRQWIGAIELSFVLDKLLGVTCKIINVRSGAELPEKCRELALHFQSQGTPVMIGGGVLAYTLLGVDHDEGSGDCAFLILDPHFTGGDDRRKIVGGGWCGWKKAVDSKGKSFFLHDKFYNLLLPQRPNMV